MKHALTILFVLAAALLFVGLTARSDAPPADPPRAAVAPRDPPSDARSASALADPALAASATRTSGAAASPAVRTLRGMIVTADGGELRAADVAVVGLADAGAEDAPVLERGGAGADGRFEIALRADAGRVAVRVEAPGYRDALAPVADDGELLVVLEPRRRTVTLVGRVVDGERLVPEFEVREYVRVESGARVALEERWTPVRQTDAGFSVVVATSLGDASRFTLRARGFVEVTREYSAIGRDRVDLGVVELVRSADHRGFVVDPGGSPVAGALVQPLFRGGDKGVAVRSSADDGSFEIVAPAGVEPESLFVSARNYAPRVVRRAEVGAWDSVVVQLEEGARIEGRVVAADGGAAGGALLRAWLADATGTELPGGALGSRTWLRTARTDERGRYAFEDVPNGAVAVAIAAANDDEAVDVRRVRTLSIADGRTATCDFRLGDGHAVRGRLEFPFALRHDYLCLELHALRGAERRVVACVESPPAEPFLFDDADWDPARDELVLRVSVAPGFHVDRPVIARGPDGDVGAIRFDLDGLLEFNRGERRVFGVAAR